MFTSPVPAAQPGPQHAEETKRLLPAKAAACFTCSPVETCNPLGNPPATTQPHCQLGHGVCWVKGPQDIPGLLKEPTAAIVIFPDSQEKAEKLALLVLASAGKFEDLGAEQHNNRKPCVVLPRFPD